MKKHKASILAVTLITLSIVLITALSISLVAIKQRNASLGSGKSNQAFQNADTGVEEVMDKLVKNSTSVLGIIPGLACSMPAGSNNAVVTGAEYKVELKKETYDPAIATTYTNCSTTKAYEIASIKSTGTGSDQESRAIEAAVAAVDSKKICALWVYCSPYDTTTTCDKLATYISVSNIWTINDCKNFASNVYGQTSNIFTPGCMGDHNITWGSSGGCKTTDSTCISNIDVSGAWNTCGWTAS